MSTLEEKQKALHKKGMNLMEKKMIRKALGQLGPMALAMGCPMDACIINIGIPSDERKVLVIISNKVNDVTMDATHTADELAGEHPLFVDLFDRFHEIMVDLAEFWNTPKSNVITQFWSNEQMEIQSMIKPKEGFPESEKIVMS